MPKKFGIIFGITFSLTSVKNGFQKQINRVILIIRAENNLTKNVQKAAQNSPFLAAKRKKTAPENPGRFWQREKDSNPHIRSQSPLCYLYTIPLNAKLLYMLFGICQVFFACVSENDFCRNVSAWNLERKTRLLYNEIKIAEFSGG